ncbi:MAG TPA: lysylphosphatidylglycerol synthase transmembrane domain-containing protein [Steroidobacteraceae bacterium]
MRATLRTLLVTVLAIGLIAVFIRNADLSRVWDEMRGAHAGYLGLAALVTVAQYFVRAERWQYLLAPLGHTRFWIAFKTTVIGFATIMVFPARAGEVLRPYLLARHEGLSATATFATIVVERILDLSAVLLLLGTALLWIGADAERAAPVIYRAIATGGAALGAATLAALGMMFVMAGHPERLHALVLRVERVLPARLAHAVAQLARTFAQGLAVVRSPRRIILALGWSLVLWVLIALYAWLVARAFGIMIPVPGAFLLSAMLVVGVSVPTPGGVGGIHEAFRLGVTSFFGADNDTAVGAAIVLHGLTTILVASAGFWFAMRDGLTIGSLKSMAGEARESGSRQVEVNP